MLRQALSCLLIVFLSRQISEMSKEVTKLKEALNSLSQLSYSASSSKRQSQQLEALQQQVKQLQNQLAVSGLLSAACGGGGRAGNGWPGQADYVTCSSGWGEKSPRHHLQQGESPVSLREESAGPWCRPHGYTSTDRAPNSGFLPQCPAAARTY